MTHLRVLDPEGDRYPQEVLEAILLRVAEAPPDQAVILSARSVEQMARELLEYRSQVIPQMVLVQQPGRLERVLIRLGIMADPETSERLSRVDQEIEERERSR